MNKEEYKILKIGFSAYKEQYGYVYKHIDLLISDSKEIKWISLNKDNDEIIFEFGKTNKLIISKKEVGYVLKKEINVYTIILKEEKQK